MMPHRLDHEIHRRIVAIRAGLAVARARAIDQARVDRLQRGGTDAQPVGDPRREVLDHDVSARDHLEQKRPPGRVLQVQRHAPLVRVQHCERQIGAAEVAAAAQMLAARRLDLDHVGAGHRHQEGRVGTVVDVRQVDDPDPGQRAGGSGRVDLCVWTILLRVRHRGPVVIAVSRIYHSRFREQTDGRRSRTSFRRSGRKSQGTIVAGRRLRHADFSPFVTRPSRPHLVISEVERRRARRRPAGMAGSEATCKRDGGFYGAARTKRKR